MATATSSAPARRWRIIPRRPSRLAGYHSPGPRSRRGSAIRRLKPCTGSPISQAGFDRRIDMEHNDRNSLWNRVFDVDSQAGTGRFLALILVFVVLGGGLSWLLG